MARPTRSGPTPRAPPVDGPRCTAKLRCGGIEPSGALMIRWWVSPCSRSVSSLFLAAAARPTLTRLLSVLRFRGYCRTGCDQRRPVVQRTALPIQILLGPSSALSSSPFTGSSFCGRGPAVAASRTLRCSSGLGHIATYATALRLALGVGLGRLPQEPHSLPFSWPWERRAPST
jgi:hypothetical protein